MEKKKEEKQCVTHRWQPKVPAILKPTRRAHAP